VLSDCPEVETIQIHSTAVGVGKISEKTWIFSSVINLYSSKARYAIPKILFPSNSRYSMAMGVDV
jgi:hypothetical protein